MNTVTDREVDQEVDIEPKEVTPSSESRQIQRQEQGFTLDDLRHLPLLIEAAKGIVNVYTWRGTKGYRDALQIGVAELEAALKPFVDGPQNQDTNQ